MLAIHPYHSPVARAELARHGGEIAYSRNLAAETKGWIAAHPLDFARLSARHLRQFFFPSPWQFYFTDWEEWRHARAILLSLMSLFGPLGFWAPRSTGADAAMAGSQSISPARLCPMRSSSRSRACLISSRDVAFLAVEALLRAGRYVVGKVGPGTAR